jgi:hypothetical protein
MSEINYFKFFILYSGNVIADVNYLHVKNSLKTLNELSQDSDKTTRGSNSFSPLPAQHNADGRP